jgi:hypothetical protein
MENMQPIQRIAGTALTAYQLVKDSSGKLVVTGAKGDRPLGLIQERGAAQDAEVGLFVSGVRKAIAAAAIAVDAELMPAAAGRVITHDGVEASYHVGRALEAATAAGDIIHIQLYDRPFPEPA